MVTSTCVSASSFETAPLILLSSFSPYSLALANCGPVRLYLLLNLAHLFSSCIMPVFCSIFSGDKIMSPHTVAVADNKSRTVTMASVAVVSHETCACFHSMLLWVKRSLARGLSDTCDRKAINSKRTTRPFGCRDQFGHRATSSKRLLWAAEPEPNVAEEPHLVIEPPVANELLWFAKPPLAEETHLVAEPPAARERLVLTAEPTLADTAASM